MKKPASGVEGGSLAFCFGLPDCSSSTRSTLFQADTTVIPLAIPCQGVIIAHPMKILFALSVLSLTACQGIDWRAAGAAAANAAAPIILEGIQVDAKQPRNVQP